MYLHCTFIVRWQTSMGAVSIIVRRLKSGDGLADTVLRRESNRNGQSSNGLIASGQYGMTKSASNLSGFSSSSTSKYTVDSYNSRNSYSTLLLRLNYVRGKFLQTWRQRGPFLPI